MKKSLAFLGGAVMLANLIFPSFEAFATGECPSSSVAKVESTLVCYDTLNEAFSSIEASDVDVDTIIMQKDTSLLAGIPIKNGKIINLNLNGFTISKDNSRDKSIFLLHGTLNLIGEGTLEETSTDGYSPIMVFGSSGSNDSNYSVLNVGNNITISGYYPIFINRTDASKSGITYDVNTQNHAYGVVVNVEGTLISPNQTPADNGAGIYINGTITDSEGNIPEINVKNGSSINSFGHGIYAAGYSKLIIDDGVEVNAGTTAIEIRAGEMEINGGTFNSNATAFSAIPDGDGSTIIGAALAISQHTTEKEIKVTVNTGTFSGIKAFYEEDVQEEPSDGITASIKAGIFSGEVSSQNILNFIEGGEFNTEISKNYIKGGSENNITVNLDNAEAKIGNIEYTTLQKAIDASSEGDTITLLSDINYSTEINDDKTFTLDLNGKVISTNKAGLITVKNGNKISIINSSENGGVNSTNGKIFYVTNGEIEINGGTYTGLSTLKTEGINSKAIVQTGTFVGQKDGNTTSIQAIKDSEITINGGYFKAGLKKSTDIKPQKVIYAGADKNKCSSSYNNDDENTVGGKIIVNGGYFDGRLSKSNNGNYEINGGIFKPADNKTAGVGCDYNQCNSDPSKDPESCHDVVGISAMLSANYTGDIIEEGVYEIKPLYSIVLSATSNGTISSDPTGKAIAGTKVKLTATPASNYTLGSWAVKDSSNTTVAVANNEFIMPGSNVTVTATFNAKSTGSSGGGSGGSSSATTSNKEETKAKTGDVNTGATEEINLGGEVTDEANANDGKTPDTSKPAVIISDRAKNNYKPEQIDAYIWAYENGITTINDIEKARLSDSLTRAELAKMMSQYISSVLKKSPIKADLPGYRDVDESLGDLADYIVKAYQYQIMGIDADGNALEYFYPNNKVTRAEYGTVFSRVLYGSVNNQKDGPYYEKHLSALKEAGILTNDNPTMEEVRGWVMIMMYRSVNPQTPAEETDNQETTDTNTGSVAEVTTGATVEAVTGDVAEATTGAIVEAETAATTGAVAEATTGSTAEVATGTVNE